MTKTLNVGDKYQGTVTRVENFGLFVEVDGVPGLLRIPELSWNAIRHPSEIADVGDHVEFQVLNLNSPEDRPREHFNGSIKILTSNRKLDEE